MFEGAVPFLYSTMTSFDSADNPDERGLIVNFPFACKVDALKTITSTNDRAVSFNITAYSDPTGTPTALSGFPVAGAPESLSVDANATGRCWALPFATPLELRANTDYFFGFQATHATAVIRENDNLFRDGADRALMPGLGTNMRGGTRQNGSGAFTESTTTIPYFALRITHIGAGAANYLAGF
jgi:hypothetical protein